jgi:hypothetical protein
MIQLSGELIDLSKVMNRTTNYDDEGGKCSGFVKVAPGNKDLFFAHVSMSGYETMTRLIKLYKFGYGL